MDDVWKWYLYPGVWMLVVWVLDNRRLLDPWELPPVLLGAMIPVINIIGAVIFTCAFVTDEWFWYHERKRKERQ